MLKSYLANSYNRLLDFRLWVKKNWGLKYVNYFNNFNPELNFYIFSDPRGGSTYLTQLIRTIPETAVLWEPLNLANAPLFHKIGFGWRQHIPENAQWPEAKKAFDKVFSGKAITNSNLFYENSYSSFLTAKKLILKICRGNALIPWLIKNFDFQFKPLLLVSHPLAVVSSQIDHGAWNKKKSSRNHHIASKYSLNDQYREKLSEFSSLEENLVATWCLTNQIPLKHPLNNRAWLTIYYEDLVIDPINQIERIFNEWNLPLPGNIDSVINQKSITTKPGSPVKGIDQLSYWKKKLNENQINSMLKVLKLFDMHHFYENSIYPNSSK